jgi:hypothetical protein
MAVEEMRDFSWSTSIRLLLFSYFNPKGRRPIDDPHAERAISFVLAWLLVILIFVSLRLCARSSFMKTPVDIAVGLVALGGLPAAILCRGYGNRILLTLQIAFVALCVLLVVYRKWPASPHVSLILLVLYFCFSTWVAWHSWIGFPLASFALWPGFDWIVSTYPQTQNVYSLLGFALSLAWACEVWLNTGPGESRRATP